MTSTWLGLLAEAQRKLADSGVDSPRVDAEFMAAHVAKVSRGMLTIASQPDHDQVASFGELIDRRANREPLQHILGTAPFRYRDLAVGPGVFVPRPETELLVEYALSHLREVSKPLVVDLCAGSGAIGLAFVHERSDAEVVLVEKHSQALRWLHRNVDAGNVRVVEGDATNAATVAKLDGRCDAVLSNPPYVPSSTAVSAEVAADPATAVFAGADGLDVIRPLIHRAAVLLRAGGVVAIEHDDTHGEVVPQLLTDAGFEAVVAHPDLTGRCRFATAGWPA